MRWTLIGLLVLAGCPPPRQYTLVRPELTCERAIRVAYRTMVTLGYTVTDVVPATPANAGAITATRPRAGGGTSTARVKVSCDASGAVLTPIEEDLVPTYEFSRAFNYSFTSLVQLPDVDKPRAASGLEVAVHALTPHEGILDLGGVPTVSGAVAARVTVRNNTDRAVALDPTRLELVPAGGASAAPLAGPALEAALAPGPGGNRVRSEQLGARRIAPHTTVTGYLVYPQATYREARIAIEDVETGETEGFVTPVE